MYHEQAKAECTVHKFTLTNDECAELGSFLISHYLNDTSVVVLDLINLLGNRNAV
jgi:hypothetical protein